MVKFVLGKKLGQITFVLFQERVMGAAAMPSPG